MHHGQIIIKKVSDMRLQRFAFNISSGLVLNGFNVLAGLLVTPLILRLLGEERLGAYYTLLEVIAYLAVFQFGIEGAFRAVFTKIFNEPGNLARQESIWVGVRLYMTISVVSLVAGLLLIPFLDFVVPVEAHATTDLRVAFLVGLIPMIFLPLTPLKVALNVMQKNYLINLFLALQVLVVTLVSILLVYLGWGITGMFAGIAVGATVFYSCIFIAARSLGIQRPEKADARKIRSQILSFNKPMFALDLCGRFSVLSDKIIVSSIVGPAAVVPFFLTQKLINLAQRQIDEVGNASWAGLAELFMQEGGEAFSERLVQLTKIQVVLGIALLGPIWALNSSFINLWVGPESYGGDLLSGLAAVNAIFLAVFSMWSWIFISTGRLQELFAATASETVVNVSLSIYATYQLGFIGPLIGTSCSFLFVTCWWLPALLKKHYQTSPRRLLYAVAVPLIPGLCYSTGISMIVRSFGDLGWVGTTGSMGLGSILFLFIAYWTLFSGKERQIFRTRVTVLRRIFSS